MSEEQEHRVDPDGPARPRTRLDPEERRHQIIEAAIRAFAGRDPAEVSFEAVADAAGVSRSLVYSYFGDRGHLFAAAYTHALARLDTDVADALDGVDDDRERLRISMRTYLEFAKDHRGMWNVIAAAGSARHPAVRDAVAARTTYIAAEIGEGEGAPLLVSGVIGMLEAAAAHMFDDGETDTEDLAEVLTQVIWTGISSL